MAQRIFDLFFATIGCVIFAPIWLLITLGILLEDGRPFLFKQMRLGKNMTLFNVYKFRSMRDQKVTRIGKWVRATGLDESLQFINVIRGDMSLVGPRPITPEDREKLGWSKSWLSWRWRVKPGITGFAQIYEPRADKKSLAKDRWDIMHNSLKLCVGYLLITVAINVVGKSRLRAILRNEKE